MLARIMLLTLLSAADMSMAQEPQATTLRVSVSLVTVGVRVVDAKGRQVSGLHAADFALSEDGVAQRIEFFSSEEQPVSLGILLDRSDSMEPEGKLGRAKIAAQLLVDACHRESEYLYAPFDAAWHLGKFIEDREQVRREIGQTSLGAGTSLYDAVLAALSRCKYAKYGRQALILITDGADQHSSHTLDDVVSAVQESQVQIFAVGYFSSLEDRIFRSSGRLVTLVGGMPVDNPRIVFERLAKESGAEAFFPGSDKELQSAVEQISKDLATQYTLAYYPSNPAPDGHYRRIQVKVRSGLRVRARPGYVLGKAISREP